MKKLALQILFTLVYVGLVPDCFADEGDVVWGEQGGAIQNYVDQVHEQLGFSGVVLAAREGKIVAVVARGKSQNGSKDDRLTNETLFEIASCTKPFTALAIMQLAENGKLSLSDSISQHLPDVPSNCHAITIRHLLSHTSGIPGTNTRGTGDDVSKVLPTFLQGGPKHEPGSHFEYWNQGYALLSEIIALASGQTYTDYVREHIFNPSGMGSSSFTGDPPRPELNVAIGTSTWGGPRSALDHPYGSYGFQYRGMGGLVSNVGDLWKWDRALNNGNLVDPASLREMVSPGIGGYGLGWFTQQDLDGEPCHRHGGSVRGFLAEIRRYPSIDGSIIILANQDPSLSFSVMKTGVEQILFDRKLEIQFPNAPSREWVQAVTGDYQDAKRRRLSIKESNGLPTLRINWGGPVTAGYLGLDDSSKPHLYLFQMAGGKPKFRDDGELEFAVRDEKAESVSLLITNPKLTFKRIAD